MNINNFWCVHNILLVSTEIFKKYKLPSPKRTRGTHLQMRFLMANQATKAKWTRKYTQALSYTYKRVFHNKQTYSLS